MRSRSTVPAGRTAGQRARHALAVAARLTLAVSCSAAPAPAAAAPTPGATAPAAAVFGKVKPDAIVARVANWVVASGNNRGARFALVDKHAATLYVFDARGVLEAHSPVLLGLTPGDRSPPGIGDKPLAQITRTERTTPAGRFVLEADRNVHGGEILWVDYDNAVSMHPVRSVNRGERRLERLATRTPADNRISYGCINVPAAFYHRWLGERISGGVLYILPEELAITSVFPLE